MNLTTLHPDPLNLTVPTDHNALTDGLDGYLYLGTAPGGFYQIDTAVNPPVMVYLGGYASYSGMTSRRAMVAVRASATRTVRPRTIC